MLVSLYGNLEIIVSSHSPESTEPSPYGRGSYILAVIYTDERIEIQVIHHNQIIVQWMIQWYDIVWLPWCSSLENVSHRYGRPDRGHSSQPWSPLHQKNKRQMHYFRYNLMLLKGTSQMFTHLMSKFDLHIRQKNWHTFCQCCTNFGLVNNMIWLLAADL